MIFIIWKDHDGTKIDEYEDTAQEEAEDKLTTVANLEQTGQYGTRLLKVIRGKAVNTKVVSRIKKISIEDK